MISFVEWGFVNKDFHLKFKSDVIGEPVSKWFTQIPPIQHIKFNSTDLNGLSLINNFKPFKSNPDHWIWFLLNVSIENMENGTIINAFSHYEMPRIVKLAVI